MTHLPIAHTRSLSLASESIKNYFRNLHDVSCNQKYAKTLPYSFHLDNVWQWASYYRDYWQVDVCTLLETITVIYGHDSIEDARLTFNDLINLPKEIMLLSNDTNSIKNVFDLCDELMISYEMWNGIFIKAAKAIYACTEEKGMNRKERHSDKFYAELIENETAVFVKLCDLLANTTFSLNQNSSMFAKYREEWPNFYSKLLTKPNLTKFTPMYDFLNSLYNLSLK